ncbi:type II secretion system protein D [Abditibacteriota bacterium]|nr:type II secretion system protein D [Abditibacteriota bacterium]
MSISFRLRPITLFVAGALLVPCAAFAQDALPSITPTDSSPAPVPAPVASPVTDPATPKPIIDSLSFNNVEVTQLLEMISTQFDVPIAVSGDVSGKISVINLKGKTAEQAIDAVIKVAGLSVQKQPDGTYIISKAPQVVAPAPLPESVNPSSVPLISPTNNGFGPLQFGGAQSGGNNGALSQFGSLATSTFSTQPEDEVRLIPTGSGTDSKERTFQVSIRNVKPSLLAYWIDPANHQPPIEIRSSIQQEGRYGHRPLVTDQFGGSQLSSQGITTQPYDTLGVTPNPMAGNPYLNSNADMVQMRSNAQFQGGGGRGGGGFGGQGGGVGGRGGQGGGTFQLPEGVSRIVAVDPQNALLVFGTPEGAAKLANTIRFLDRPLRQVEIEAQFLSINTSAAQNYGFDFTTARGNFNASSTGTATSTAAGGLQFGFIRGNFQAAIAASITSGRAKLLTAPRVTAINNLTATLEQSTSTPIVLTTTNTVANNAIAQNTSQQVFYVTTTIGLEVTPTINNDDTVTVLMRPVLQAQGTPNSLGASQITSQQLETIANVRDGETIALGGLRSVNITLNKTKVPLIGDLPLIGHLFRSRSNSEVENELIIFLTARIIRRVGDDDAVGATDIPVGVGG